MTVLRRPYFATIIQNKGRTSVNGLAQRRKTQGISARKVSTGAAFAIAVGLSLLASASAADNENKIVVPESPGLDVKVGETVVVIESMKMDNNMVSAVNGTIAEIYVKLGDQVQAGQELAMIR